MILNAMEQLNKIWKIILPYISGITIGGIVSCVFFVLFKFGFNKALNKIDTKALEQKCIDKAENMVRTTTFKTNIQPIVVGELSKCCDEISQKNSQELEKYLATTLENYAKIIAVLEALGNYFDDSIAISTQKKEALYKALENAKEQKPTNESVVNVVVAKEKNNVVAKETKETTIER